MLSYHPALDVYQTAFRLLGLFGRDQTAQYELERLYVCDFLALFPSSVTSVRLPATLMKWRRLLGAEANPYFFGGDTKLVFWRMQPIQEAAARLLQKRGYLDESAFARGFAALSVSAPKTPLLQRAFEAVRDSAVHEFLGELNRSVPLKGAGGLKERTGLVEYRYDLV